MKPSIHARLMSIDLLFGTGKTQSFKMKLVLYSSGSVILMHVTSSIRDYYQQKLKPTLDPQSFTCLGDLK